MTQRLAEDHARAARLAEGLARIPGIEVAPVSTNILYFWLTEETSRTPEQVVDGLAERGILLLGRENGRFRAVTHYWIDDAAVEKTLRSIEEVMA
jgi:threonine aldolase